MRRRVCDSVDHSATQEFLTVLIGDLTNFFLFVSLPVDPLPIAVGIMPVSVAKIQPIFLACSVHKVSL